MNAPLTRVLLKIFAYRFYREHSGLLLFFFVTVLNYCFFIKTAGVYRAEDSVFYHLMLVMSFIVTPVILIAVLALWTIYTFKSWQYVSKQLRLPDHQFLFYSVTSYSRFEQFKSWFSVQLVISLPLIGYWFLAMVLGLIYHANLIPVITLAFILLMATLSAFFYMDQINRLNKTKGPSVLMRFSSSWNKPYGSLFLYFLFDRLKLAFCLTKILSFLLLMGMLSLFSSENGNDRIPALIVLGIATIHSFLIYRDHWFKEVYLGFSRNLPFHRTRLFLSFLPVYFTLALPETLWLFSKFSFGTALSASIFGAGIALLFRSLVYLTGLKIYSYLLCLFGLFILLFYLVLFGHFWWVTLAALLSSFLVFYFNYYREKTGN